LVDRLQRLISRGKRHPNLLYAVLFIDLDRFKLINDSLGHAAGDQMIIEASARFRKCIRGEDLIARLGGDEFVILLEDVANLNVATHIAQRVLRLLEPPFQIEGQEIYVGASVGIVLNNPEYLRPEDFLRDADTAMYRAKSSGRGRYQVFDTRMHKQAVTALRLEGDLRRALDRKEFTLHYQPIISLSTGSITRLEALARWSHPEHGIIPPNDFIPLAEETGLIFQFGSWVLNEVCQQSQAWREKGYPVPHVAVNVSARQFQQKGFANLIKSILKETDNSALTMEIEITESVAMGNIEHSIQLLKELRETGLRISIDDFGTGYSSLSCLKMFPIDNLKIDRGFIQDLTTNNNNAAITKAIINVAHNLGFKVVAEGVETREQMQFLKEHECDEVQGYYFSKPLPADEIIKVVQDWKFPA
ncbi:MAG: EAL domain-containing protein, partial [Candidatus Omnitrophica bacterium]|nr:EAL domain-containing protein [Candidatus Omnitrophota bacterium]